MAEKSALKSVLARSVETSVGVLDPLLDEIAGLADIIADCFLRNGTLYIFCHAEWLSEYAAFVFLNNADYERPEFPAVCLGPANIARSRLKALARSADCLLILDCPEINASPAQEPEGNSVLDGLLQIADDRGASTLAVLAPNSSAQRSSTAQLALQLSSQQQLFEAQLLLVHALIAHCEYRIFASSAS